MGTLDVALQLERSQIFAVAMMASGVAVPALTVLLLQLQVVLHVVHEPAETVHTHTNAETSFKKKKKMEETKIIG